MKSARRGEGRGAVGDGGEGEGLDLMPMRATGRWGKGWEEERVRRTKGVQQMRGGCKKRAGEIGEAKGNTPGGKGMPADDKSWQERKGMPADDTSWQDASDDGQRSRAEDAASCAQQAWTQAWTQHGHRHGRRHGRRHNRHGHADLPSPLSQPKEEVPPTSPAHHPNHAPHTPAGHPNHAPLSQPNTTYRSRNLSHTTLATSNVHRSPPLFNLAQVLA
eukprot:365111-Chlamydomonas_euryale.AAC.4